VNLELSRSGKPCQERISATGWAPESWADSPNKWDSASSGRDTSRPVAASMAGSVRTTDNCQCRVQRAVRRDLDPPAVLPTLSMCPDHPTFALWLFGITGAAVTHIENPLTRTRNLVLNMATHATSSDHGRPLPAAEQPPKNAAAAFLRASFVDPMPFFRVNPALMNGTLGLRAS
jgi:hypothetical protein